MQIKIMNRSTALLRMVLMTMHVPAPPHSHTRRRYIDAVIVIIIFV